MICILIFYCLGFYFYLAFFFRREIKLYPRYSNKRNFSDAIIKTIFWPFYAIFHPFFWLWDTYSERVADWYIDKWNIKND